MMSENKFDNYITRKNHNAEDKVFALKSDKQSPLVYVKLPKNNESMAPSFTISKTTLPGSTNITLSTKMSSQFGPSKSDICRTVTMCPSQTCASKITMRSLNSFPNSQVKVSVANSGHTPNISGKSLIRSNTLPSISSIVVSAVSGTVMSQSIQTSAKTSLTVVNSGSALKLSPGILRSPTLGHKLSPGVKVPAASSKPVILHSKVVSTAKKSPNASLPSNVINLSKQGFTHNRSNNAMLSSSPILQSNVSKAERFIKNKVPKNDGGKSCLWNPPPIILQSGRNFKTVCKSGPTAISIVTGKGSHGNNTISVIPLARKGLSKRNMVNLKISNGQIVSGDSSQKAKVDSMAPVCDSRSVSVTSLNPQQDSALDDNMHLTSTSEGSTTFFRRGSDDGGKPKDILEEAMCAMASDIDELSIIEDSTGEYPSFTKTSHSSINVPKPKYTSVGGSRYTTNIVVPEQLSLLESTSSASSTSVCNMTETALAMNSVLPSKAPIPISIPFSASSSVTNTELPGLIIRTDSVTVRRKVSKEEIKKESLKPDLSIIPILRNNSVEKSPLKKNSIFMDLEKFADGKATRDLLKGPLLNLCQLENDGNGAVEISKPSSSPTDNSSLDGLDDDVQTGAAEEQDFSKILKWNDGMGALTGSDLKFQLNEFGAIELVDDGAVDVIKKAVKDEIETSAELLDNNSSRNQVVPAIHIHHARKPNHHKDIKKDEETDMTADSENLTKVSKDFYDICCCKNCGCYGLCSEFLKEKGNNFCTMSCSEDYEVKEMEWNKEKIRLEKNKTKSKKLKGEDVDAVTKFESNEKENMDQLQSFLSQEKESKIDSVNSEVKLQLTWKGSKQTFSWVKYLEQCGKNKGQSRAAPLKLWTEPFPFGRNLFKAGMKVEGIDPQHQSLFCVMTVVDVIGHRIRLHFDGFSPIHDFWCNDGSPNIFQVGWCEKNGRKLETPPGIANFTWKAYLEHCKVAPAPKQAFSTRSCTTVTTPSNFRIGMKLEAEDRKNGWTCVATVADVLDNRILVHFDGWEKAFDTWFDVNSPFIHPVGWCSSNGVFLFPPKDYLDPDNFSWQEYIQETNSVAVPARAFKTRAPKNFKKDMKIEAVDKRNPMLVRVCSIVDIKSYKLKIHFDGWSDEYDYWVDDDSPDIHPPTWCSKTGHPLQPPLNLNIEEMDMNFSNGCGTPGCKGYGHVKGLIYCSHHTSYGCPYSSQNLDKDWEVLLPDRLELSTFESKPKASKQIINLDESKPIPIDLDEDDFQKKRVRKRRKFFDELSPPECSKIKIPRMSSDDPRIPVLSSFKSNTAACTYNTRNSATNEITILKPSTPDEGRIDSIVHRSIFNPFYHPKPPVPRPLTLEAHKKFVSGKDVQKLESEKWTSKDVRQFISAIAGCNLVAKKFTEHKIDGKSLLMMTQQDLIDILGIKLGPAIKIMASIISVRNTL